MKHFLEELEKGGTSLLRNRKWTNTCPIQEQEQILTYIVENKTDSWIKIDET